MIVVVVSAILLTAIPTPPSARVTLSDMAGMWVTVSGDCNQGQHLLSLDGKYKVWCFDSISEGKWSLRDGNRIVVRLGPKENDEEIITVVRLERYSDHTVVDIRYENGTREKWMK